MSRVNKTGPTIAREITNLVELKRDTLILLFSRPDNGKQLAAGQRAHQRVWTTLQQHSRQQAEATGLPVLLWDATQQVGNTFAERLTHALTTLQAAGWQRVIVIGDDCPELHHAQLTAAANALANSQSVLGPDKDGGAYLIGLSLEHFDPITFQALPWQTDQLLLHLVHWLSVTAPVHFLTAQHDIDTAHTLRQLVRSYRLHRTLQLLLQQWLLTPVTKVHSVLGYARAYFRQTRYRGPPVGI